MTRRLCVILASLVALWVGNPAYAQLSGENILTPVPAGFKVGAQFSQGNVSAMELIPEKETVTKWSVMITQQTFRGMQNLTPDQFAENLGNQVKSACEGTEAMKSIDGVENGYAFSIWVISCPLNKSLNTPEFFFLKVIQGQDAIYDVQYAYRKPLSEEIVPPAMRYLERVTVCDTRDATHPCPKGM